MLGLPEENEPRRVLISVTTWPSAEVGEPAPRAAPAGAPAGMVSSMVVAGVPAGAEVIEVTARAPAR